ncbi:hypothetical protein L2E82_06445 [Cichorium intybus]|uniref:Uncharacterized protein n=1 Tax=Cichorium intybus TaxID=13427 RepID=A0ACB9HA23_CICIN|nr:hypothetical protein L2E82_06445 [Cichorium intybus]
MMAAETTIATTQPPPELTDEMTVKKVHKRYEGLMMVRTKAIKGKGAWYWAHLEPVLVHNPDSGLPKAVKLRCSLCAAVFSASNPSRTASEHLKRGTCRNYNPDSNPRPISSISPIGVVTLASPTSSSSPQQNHRKRNSSGKRSGHDVGSNGANTSSATPSPTYSAAPVAMIEPAQFPGDVSYPNRNDSVPALPTATVMNVSSGGIALQLVSLDEGYKIVSMEDQAAREIEEMMRDSQFWKELDAVHSLVKLIKSMAEEIEKERPRIGQCLPLWEELRLKIKNWCAEFQVNEDHVDKVFDKRFKRNYHPAWAAAFILDPFYLIRDTSGKYLPPFKYLTSEQEKDVDKLITRLVSREEAHIALMELMKWRTEGLDPVYAQAVQLKQRDPITGKMRIANPQSSSSRLLDE